MLPRRPLFAALALVLLLVTGGWLLRQTRSGAPYVSSETGRAAPGSSTEPPEARTSPQGSVGDLRRVSADTGGDTLPDILESEGAQLMDILDQLKASCAQARPSRGGTLSIGRVTRCVEDAEGAVNLVDLLRGTVEGPAGARMPGEVRKRWQGTLVSSTGAIREGLTPIWDAVGRVLATGGHSPEEFRALGHLRDRIGRVLTAAGPPAGPP